MQTFLDRHREKIVGVLSGFDRLLFCGTLRSLEYQKGFEAFLATHRGLYKDFANFAKGRSSEAKAHAKAFPKRHGRPLIYLHSPAISKEDYARRLMQRDGITQGLICVLTCVELCRAFKVRRNRETRQLEFGLANRKCLFIYFYFADRELGLMHVRLQTWLPMPIK